MKTKISIFWFRRDLRLEDNTGLNHSLNSRFPVLPIFIFDEEILNKLDDKSDRRVDYIHQALQNINNKLKNLESKLTTFLGKPSDIFQKLHVEYDVQSVYCNRDYEPQAINRDREIYDFFKTYNIPFKAYKDQVIFDKSDITKPDGSPYTVYTPYSKKWKLQFQTD
ncbi:MAG: deoxyribodipyrimidine photo-lyase, partial [Myroides sp.]